jgi:hypothetical protein
LLRLVDTTVRAEHASPAPTDNHAELSSGPLESGTDDGGSELEPALGELKHATEALLETTAQLKEFSREIAGTFDCSPPTYPDESLSLDIEHDGKVVGWTVVDSSGFLMQVGQSACNRELVTPP